ncbi:MAG: DUF3991 and toprim domain-containing protein [Clostridiaceae bacterium]|nr:DUF3991 and toprim domain-containing protein [Clostridiaceae bacterium]
MKKYTREDFANAKKVSLTQLARSMGYTPVSCGVRKHKLKEMDSLMIYDDATWYRWSGRGNRVGGSQIDFMLEYGNCMNVSEAVEKLLEFAGINPQMIIQKPVEQKQQKADFCLPAKNQNYRRMYAYLMKTRGLSSDVISYMVKQKLIYEEADHHNIVFCGRDEAGTVRYAAMRGTCDAYGRPFKGDVEGNDKNYGVNIVNPDSQMVKVFESTIDCMSYMDLTGDYKSNKLILGMLSDQPLQTFLSENLNIRIIDFCLDNDVPAMKAVYGKKEPGRGEKEGLLQKYKMQGYQVSAHPAPKAPGCKDYNEFLLYQKKIRPPIRVLQKEMSR